MLSGTPPMPDLNPPTVQRYVVEHIMKNDDNAIHLSAVRLRSFSGRAPRPPHETDYETWRSSIDLLLQDPAISDLQRSRRLVESLFPPAADMVKHLKPDTLPKVYLQILDSAYGAVQDGDELYAKFMELFQDAGEKPSAYLQRLQIALVAALKRGGVKATDVDRHLLNQFCRGCWDNNLISELQLKRRKSNPPSFSDLLLLLRTEEDREASKAQRMKQHLGSKARAGALAQYAYTHTPEEEKVDALTNITQQLAQQLADIQKQLRALTAGRTSRNQSATYQSIPAKNSKPIRTPHKSSSAGPKPGYCYNCGEDGHIRPDCNNDPNPTLVAMKKKQFSEKQKRQQKPHRSSSLN
uniref:CCHC-type domain-containing protein n=1 Tax=Oryzias latipes TaxID=8090 RepID=A0A3P9LM99_ORYLA